MAKVKENSNQKIWKSVLSTLKTSLGEASFTRFVDGHVKLIKLDDNKCIFSCDDSLGSAFLSRKANREKIKEALEQETREEYDIEIVVDKDSDEEDEDDFEYSDAVSTNSNDDFMYKTFDQSLVDKTQTFDNFVVADSNKQAYKACNFMLQGTTITSLVYIYADSGLGKTHLLNAVYNEFKKRYPNKTIKYVRANDFTDVCFNIFRKEKKKDHTYNSTQVKDFFKETDFLLFDDIQFIYGREHVQTIFFDFLDYLYKKKVPMIFTSDTATENTKGLENRIHTRISDGINCSIKYPVLDTVIKVLKTKIELLGLTVDKFDDDALEYIAKRNLKNIRGLGNVLGSLLMETGLNPDPNLRFTLDMCMEVLEGASYIPRQKQEIKKNVTIDDIINATSDYFGVGVSQIKSKVRTSQIALARQVAMYISREIVKASFTEIGREFDKDHSTVMNNVSKIAKLLKTDENLVKTVENIKSNFDIN